MAIKRAGSLPISTICAFRGLTCYQPKYFQSPSGRRVSPT